MWTPADPETCLERWHLTVDGAAVTTQSSTLIPVLHEGRRAMLKVARLQEEGFGCRVLAWWNGHGAARVWEVDDRAAVMELAEGGHTLAELCAAGDDDTATRVLCDIASTLHGASSLMVPPGGLVPLREWFRALFLRAERQPREYGGVWPRTARLADELLSDPSQDLVLHGDLHHANVLEFAPGDWRAIDPKSVIGNRLFDYTALLVNPDDQLAADHFDRRVELVARAAGVPRHTVLQWAVAATALRAAWFADDGQPSNAERMLRHTTRADTARRAH